MNFRTVVAAIAIFLSTVGCGKRAAETPFDAKSGNIVKNQKLSAELLIPAEIKIPSELKNFTIIEHLAFLGERDTVRKAMTVNFRRALSDNKYIRAERDFSGFVYDGSYFQTLPYMKAKHDSTRLDHDYAYPFGGLSWNTDHTGGSFKYDRRDIKLRLEFAGLEPVQANNHGELNRRMNALGNGLLVLGEDSLSGLVIYELIMVEGYNPIKGVSEGIEFTNYDWLILQSQSGGVILASSDSTTANDRILKNFVYFQSGDSSVLADGSEKVRIVSSELRRDPKIYDMLALKKSLAVVDADISMELSLIEPRIFYTNGYCLSVVTGTLNRGQATDTVWGLIEHWQQPKSDGSVLQ